MTNEYEEMINEWQCTFYLSTKNEISDISWVKDYASVIPSLKEVKNTIYYSLYLCVKGEDCFVLTYGKSHFYIRNFCDPEFGLEIAKRIANKKDIKQKAVKKYAGNTTKQIGSFKNNTELDNESGESIDYINASILTEHIEKFGKKAKF